MVAAVGHHALLARPGAGGQIVRPAFARQQRTVVAVALVFVAVARVVADGCGGPCVVHGPHHGLVGVEYLPDALQREHSLVYPAKMYHVGFLKLAQLRYVGSRVGYVNFKEVSAREARAHEYGKPLPEEAPLHTERAGQAYDGYLVGLLVAHQHLGFHTVVLQSFHQAVGGHGGPPGLLARVYYQYSHGCLLRWGGHCGAPACAWRGRARRGGRWCCKCNKKIRIMAASRQ